MDTIVVGISDIKMVQRPQRLVTYGLGSCVAILIYNRRDNTTGMAHVMLPMALDRDQVQQPGKYADTAVGAIMGEFEEKEVGHDDLVAKIAGGAEMFPGKYEGVGSRIGARNILAVRKTLASFGIELIAQDVGGNLGRTVEFNTETLEMVVRTLKGGVKVI